MLITPVYTYTRTYGVARIQVSTYMYGHKCTRTTHVYIQTYTYVHTRTYTDTHAHTIDHTYHPALSLFDISPHYHSPPKLSHFSVSYSNSSLFLHVSPLSRIMNCFLDMSFFWMIRDNPLFRGIYEKFFRQILLMQIIRSFDILSINVRKIHQP